MKRIVWTLLATGLAALTMGARGARRRPGVGRPRSWRGRLGDLRRGRPLGGQHQRPPSRVDALGSTAYYDNGEPAETIPGCHRSKAAEIHIGGGVNCREPRVLGRAHLHAALERGRTSSRAWTSTTTAPATSARPQALQSSPRRTT